MSFYSNTCQLTSAQSTLSEVEARAQRLAFLLSETVEFQNYLRLERAVNLDPQVQVLTEKLHMLQMAYVYSTDEDGNTVDSLTAQIEALPIVAEFRRAQQAVRALFTAVDTVISQSAGLSFAKNTRCVFT